MQITARKPANLVGFFQQITNFNKKSHSVKWKHKQITKTVKTFEILIKMHFLIECYYITGHQWGRKSLPGTNKDIRFSAFWIPLHLVSVKHQLFKNSEKGVKTGKAYRYRDQSGLPFYTKMEHWIPWGRKSHIGKKTHKKINFFVVFFCAKNDEGENCQQRKVLTSSPIRIAQFHEKSFFENTQNKVKSHVFEHKCGRA